MGKSFEIALPGDLIDQKYQVIRVLGTGSSATVFLVRGALTDELMAMKMLNKEVVHDDETNKRFEREATALSKLSHDGLVTIYDFGRSATGRPYFVTDFVEGRSLSEILKKEKRLPARRACAIFIQICEAMEYAHQEGLIHRDLKPSNIMIRTGRSAGPTEGVKIVDFGIVKFAQSSNEQAQNLRLTQDGRVLGSPFYMSPEQCQGKDLDSRSDIYSLGCLMHEVLGGKPPFDGDSALATFVKQVTVPAPSLSAQHPDLEIAAELESIVMKALAKAPDDRYQSMSELADVLNAFLCPKELQSTVSTHLSVPPT